ncbi:ABC transporter permease [Alkaliphilus serpentinus]|uniref:ABC transporter permease n=1 Tax=Alkaliphilus serpentinus TaxID=1482731 RepID=A0A833HR30_9FIRM|nr:ABC transporter permease [Alkaliphilus serpentinus]KAB3532824.1 ABC transporter permease [Alkaliphilus serpentinus]
MNKLGALCFYQFKLQLRDYVNMFFVVAFPVLMFIIFGSILDGLLHYDGISNAIDYLLPSYIPIVITNTAVLIFGTLLVNHKEHNFFIKYKLLGFKPVHVAFALFFSVLIFQFLGIAALILTAVLTNDIALPINNLHNVLIIMITINIFQFALAFFLSTVFNKSAVYQTVALIIFYFQMFLGGMTFPPEMFTETITKMTEIFNPIIHGLYVIRGVWVEGKSILDFPLEMMILLGVSCGLLVLGSKLFNWNSLNTK